ncbi:MAG: hypothetical protein NVV66_08425 [Cellulomonas sp.]|uniref:hypothetical protein n=1 Tax=Cellulomonas sp. TaxID=40001 RepID=UPI002585DE18|nr:hypothetical protein [Cellulomonas sp.]MCR6704709.1 hypothetical protein [Cellulomonas sp.]
MADEHGDAAVNAEGNLGVSAGPEDGQGAGVGVEEGDLVRCEGKASAVDVQGSCRKNAKVAASMGRERPDMVRRQNLKLRWTPSKSGDAFSKSKSAASDRVSTRSLKKYWVVASVAMPVGTMIPACPVVLSGSGRSSAKTA